MKQLSPRERLLLFCVVLVKVSLSAAKRGGGSSSSTNYEYIEVSRADGAIVYTVWNYMLWALSAIIILGLLLSLLVLHIILTRRQKTRAREERSKILLKEGLPAFIRTSTNLKATAARNGKASKRIEPENDCKIYEVNDVK